VISGADQERLVSIVQRDWDLEVETEAFRAICSGKERGHRIADHAEERTLEFMELERFPVAYEHAVGGARRPRSMGDVWLRSGPADVFNPINVKAGMSGVGGQPNMVSLAKLTDGLLKHHIDSYWLLLIRIRESEAVLSASVKLVNIFDYLEFMHFDSGPGQIMLKSDSFYEYLEDGGGPLILSLEQVALRLLEIRRDGDLRLITNRAKRSKALELAAAAFDPDEPLDQSRLTLDPVKIV
jgi:hypothetical protein